MIAKESYIQRRKKLKEKVGTGLILLLGNNESPMNYADNTFHFRQDSTYLYFFGINHPNLAGVLDCDSGEEWIFGNDLTVEDFVWMGPQPTIAKQAEDFEIYKTASINELVKKLKAAANSGRKIHFLPPYRPENKIKLLQWLGVPVENQKETASLELTKAVIEQRNYKNEEEIDEIIKAANTSVDMHTLAMRMAKPGVSESKITAAV